MKRQNALGLIEIFGLEMCIRDRHHPRPECACGDAHR